VPSAPTHLCWFYVRFVHGIFSCAPLCLGRLRSGCRRSKPTPDPLLLRRPQGTVILAFPIWVACQLSIRDRLNSTPVSRRRVPFLPDSLFSFDRNLWVFGRVDSLVSTLFVTHINILTSDRMVRLSMPSRLELSPSSFPAIQNVLLPFGSSNRLRFVSRTHRFGF